MMNEKIRIMEKSYKVILITKPLGGDDHMEKTLKASEYETVVKEATKPFVLEFGADW